MLELATSDALRASGDMPDICRLTPDTLILIWNLPTRLWKAPKLEAADGRSVSPQATLRLPLENGGTRLIRVLPRPKDDPLTLLAEAGTLGRKEEFTLDPDGDFDVVDPDWLLEDVTPSGRLSLIATMLGAWASMFRMRRSRSYTNVLNRLVARIIDRPQRGAALARLTDKQCLLAAGLPHAFGSIEAAFLVSATGDRKSVV